MIIKDYNDSIISPNDSPHENNNWSYFESSDTTHHTIFKEELFNGIFGTLFITFIIVLLIVIIISIISNIKIFKKAGQKGWKSIIPIYNSYILFEISGLKGWYAFLMLIPILGILAAIILTIICDIKLAKSFGKDTSFAVGLIFFPIIFLPILGFDNSKYLGPDITPNNE